MDRKKIFTAILIFALICAIQYGNNRSPLNNNVRDMFSKAPLQTSNISNPSVGIFYDDRYSEPWNFDAQTLTNYLNQTLNSYNLIVNILNATELKTFMENNPAGIIIITMGLVPETIWNGSENSFVETWLDNGGIIIWTGCQEFYWIGYATGENTPIGQMGSKYVLDMDYVVTLSNQIMNPTQLGNDIMVNLYSHSSDVFCSISALTTANVYFEVYAKNNDLADPVLLQPKNGKGYFIRIHADWDNKLSVSDLSTWISSFIYNRFFRLPIITESDTINSIYMLTSKELFINVTNYSEYFAVLQLNSSSVGFYPINSSSIILPHEKQELNLIIRPLESARFQNYELQLNIFSNYTDSQNNSKILCIFSGIINISVQVPLSITILAFSERMYPGSTYAISCDIKKLINTSFPIVIVLIGEGCINELKTSINLDQTEKLVTITFTVQLMAKAGAYQLHIRVYQEEALYSSLNVPIQIQSIFQHPLMILLIILLCCSLIGLFSLFLYQRRKRNSLDQEIMAILESKNMVFLTKIEEALNINKNQIQKRINSYVKARMIEGYLVSNEKNEMVYLKKAALEPFVLNTISKLKTSNIYEIAEILKLDPKELTMILTNQLKSKN